MEILAYPPNRQNIVNYRIKSDGTIASWTYDLVADDAVPRLKCDASNASLLLSMRALDANALPNSGGIDENGYSDTRGILDRDIISRIRRRKS